MKDKTTAEIVANALLQVSVAMSEVENRLNGAVSILRDVEWSRMGECPVCRCDPEMGGHADSCELGQFLDMEA